MADTQAPNRWDNLYATWFQRNGEHCDPKDADRVLMQVWGRTSNPTTFEFKLPRDAHVFNVVKFMVIAAYNVGHDASRAEIRDVLGIKECNHVED